jgi:hypothetical protein
MTLDLYGPLPTGRGGVKYLLVCLDVFQNMSLLTQQLPQEAVSTNSDIIIFQKYYNLRLYHQIADHNLQVLYGRMLLPNWTFKLDTLLFGIMKAIMWNVSCENWENISEYTVMKHKKWPEPVTYIQDWLN